jgi:uncharacterized protein (TIGR03437 family)
MGCVRLFILFWAAAALGAEAPWPTHGWRTSTPEEQGMDSILLAQSDPWIRANSPNRFSFLVIRNGYLVYERYYNGRTAASKEHVASISKSFLSALTGIAIEQGLAHLEDRWFDAFPEYATAPLDPRTTSLTIRHMLTMSPGLAWTDDTITSWMLDSSGQYPDWLRFTLQQPFENPPGEAFHYNTGNTHLLSAFLTHRTGLATRDFAVLNLLAPLGITDFDWWRDCNWPHYYTGGWGMVLQARDVAKLGYLYLHDGLWEGRQIVPKAWVRASTAPQIRSGPEADDFYGYLWWLGNWRGFFIPQASGHGGQRIWFSRELNLVAVTTADTANDTGLSSRLMNNYVLPSIFRRPPAVIAGAVVNAPTSGPVIAPDSFVSIYGENLAPAEAGWDSVILDGQTLPTMLGGVEVKIAGRDCYLSYAGPNQVNVLTPPDLPPGPAEVEVTHPGGTARSTVTVAPAAPALFPVATYAGEYVFVAETGALPGAASRPARPGDNIELWASGLGATAAAHPAGEVLRRYYPLAGTAIVRVYFNDVEAIPQAVNMTYAGLWQVNVQVPEVPAGDVRVSVRAGGETSPPIVLRAAAGAAFAR